MLETPFCQNIARKTIKKCFLARASHIKQQQQQIVAHLTGHGNAQLA
jgi:hypothetical protein